MGLLQAVNIEENFWDLNPEIKYMSPFRELYDSDQKDSSKLMWAIYLYCDPDSRFARMSIDERRDEIQSNFLPSIKWNEPFIVKIIKGYEDRLLSKLENSYNRLLKKLEERDEFISKTKYNEKNAKMLDSMFANSSEIYTQLSDIGDELKAEKKGGSVKGGRKESLSEQKKI